MKIKFIRSSILFFFFSVRSKFLHITSPVRPFIGCMDLCLNMHYGSSEHLSLLNGNDPFMAFIILFYIYILQLLVLLILNDDMNEKKNNFECLRKCKFVSTENKLGSNLSIFHPSSTLHSPPRISPFFPPIPTSLPPPPTSLIPPGKIPSYNL